MQQPVKRHLSRLPPLKYALLNVRSKECEPADFPLICARRRFHAVAVRHRTVGLRPAEIGYDAVSLLQLFDQHWVTPHTHSVVIGAGDPGSAAPELAADRKRDDRHVRIKRVRLSIDHRIARHLLTNADANRLRFEIDALHAANHVTQSCVVRPAQAPPQLALQQAFDLISRHPTVVEPRRDRDH